MVAAKAGTRAANSSSQATRRGWSVRQVPAKAEVAIAERAGERDLADIGRRVERRRRCLERGERARDLAGLQVEPFLLVRSAAGR